MSSTAEDFDTARSLLQNALVDPVPIHALQRFAPEFSFGRHFGPPAWDARRAAVTVLLYQHQGMWTVPMTLRPATLGMHGGQVSFPGGALELDETSEQCAVREWCEELGEPGVDFYWVGKLKPIYVFHSNYIVLPHVAVAHDCPRFQPDPREVAELLEVPLAHLCDPQNYGEHWIQRGGLTLKAPHINFLGHLIWGATAIMLSELIQVVRRAWCEP